MRRRPGIASASLSLTERREEVKARVHTWVTLESVQTTFRCTLLPPHLSLALHQAALESVPGVPGRTV